MFGNFGGNLWFLLAILVVVGVRLPGFGLNVFGLQENVLGDRGESLGSFPLQENVFL